MSFLLHGRTESCKGSDDKYPNFGPRAIGQLQFPINRQIPGSKVLAGIKAAICFVRPLGKSNLRHPPEQPAGSTTQETCFCAGCQSSPFRPQQRIRAKILDRQQCAGTKSTTVYFISCFARSKSRTFARDCALCCANDWLLHSQQS